MKHQSHFARGLDLGDRAWALNDLLDSLNLIRREALDCDCDEALEELRWGIESTQTYMYDCDRDDALEIEDYVNGALADGLSALEIVALIDEAIELGRDSLEYVGELNAEEEEAEERRELSAYYRDCRMAS